MQSARVGEPRELYGEIWVMLPDGVIEPATYQNIDTKGGLDTSCILPEWRERIARNSAAVKCPIPSWARRLDTQPVGGYLTRPVQSTAQKRVNPTERAKKVLDLSIEFDDYICRQYDDVKHWYRRKEREAMVYSETNPIKGQDTFDWIQEKLLVMWNFPDWLDSYRTDDELWMANAWREHVQKTGEDAEKLSARLIDEYKKNPYYTGSDNELRKFIGTHTFVFGIEEDNLIALLEKINELIEIPEMSDDQDAMDILNIAGSNAFHTQSIINRMYEWVSNVRSEYTFSITSRPIGIAKRKLRREEF